MLGASYTRSRVCLASDARHSDWRKT